MIERYRYYKFVIFTPYVGEEESHYLKLSENMDVQEWIRTESILDEWLYEVANEWWDEQTCAEYEGIFDDYLADCNYTLQEISEGQYLEEKDPCE